MSSHTSSHVPHHGGLERVIERAEATQSVLSRMFSAKQLPTYVLGITIMAVVTLTERAMDAIDTGFAFEWIVLSAVALASFGLLSNGIVRGTQSTQRWFAAYARQARAARADEKIWATAHRDPRVMNDILAAQGRSQDTLLDEPRSAKSNAMQVQDDGLAPLAPWMQLTRYY
jgi:hypothetical protein